MRIKNELEGITGEGIKKPLQKPQPPWFHVWKYGNIEADDSSSSAILMPALPVAH